MYPQHPDAGTIHDGTHSPAEVGAYIAHLANATKVYAGILAVILAHLIASAVFFGYHLLWKTGNGYSPATARSRTTDTTVVAAASATVTASDKNARSIGLPRGGGERQESQSEGSTAGENSDGDIEMKSWPTPQIAEAPRLPQDRWSSLSSAAATRGEYPDADTDADAGGEDERRLTCIESDDLRFAMDLEQGLAHPAPPARSESPPPPTSSWPLSTEASKVPTELEELEALRRDLWIWQYPWHGTASDAELNEWSTCERDTGMDDIAGDGGGAAAAAIGAAVAAGEVGGGMLPEQNTSRSEQILVPDSNRSTSSSNRNSKTSGASQPRRRRLQLKTLKEEEKEEEEHYAATASGVAAQDNLELLQIFQARREQGQPRQLRGGENDGMEKKGGMQVGREQDSF